MATTVSSLISNSWYKSGFIPADVSPDGSSVNIGLRELVRAMSRADVDGDTLPFLTHTEVPMIAGQESYEVPGLLSITSLSYNNGDIRYPLHEMTADAYFSGSRVDNISSLPSQFYAERIRPELKAGVQQEEGTTIYLYFEPNQAYTLNIVGKYSDNAITLLTDLEQTYPLWMIDYLELSLAKRLCQYYSMACPQTILSDLSILERKITLRSAQPKLKRQANFLSGSASSIVRRMWEGFSWG